MSMVFRETRPSEVTDAVMFVMSGGQAVEAGSVRHDLSHVAQQDGEVIGAVVLGRDADGQETVTVHSTPPSPEVPPEAPPRKSPRKIHLRKPRLRKFRKHRFQKLFLRRVFWMPGSLRGSCWT